MEILLLEMEREKRGRNGRALSGNQITEV